MVTLTCPVCRRTQPHSDVCPACRTTIIDDLTEVGRRRAELAGFLQPARRGRRASHWGKPTPQAPGRLDVMAATDPRSRAHPGTEDNPADNVPAIDARLIRWARDVRHDFAITGPLTDVFDALRILNIHRERIMTAWPAAFATDLHRTARELAALTGDTGEPRVADCPQPDPRGVDDTCGGPMRLDYRGPIPTDPDIPLAATHLVCGRCHDEWPVDENLWRLLRVTTTAHQFPVDRAWAAAKWHIDPATLRKWISRGHITTYADGQIELHDLLLRIQEEDIA